ncbi:RecT family recombinase [Photobacterium aquae]|uniref:RecT family recombinase n=1 Tax=Photobacterium aquae TaxID=1195763 RepID=UPI00069D8658|nr:RecT family recombinase [Photobacterium aquae]
MNAVTDQTALSTTKEEKPSLIRAFASRYEIDPAKVLDTLKKVIFKPKNGDPEIEDVTLMSFLLVCQRYDLDPFRKEIIPMQDKRGGFIPVVTIDGWLKVITTHPDCDGFEFIYSSEKISVPDLNRQVPASCTCIMYRKNWSHPVKIEELTVNCYRPKLTLRDNRGGTYQIDTPWQTHFERLLRHKATIQTARYTFGMSDIYDQDEYERIIESQEKMSGNIAGRSMQPLDITPTQTVPVLEHKQDQSLLNYFEDEVNLVQENAECIHVNDTPVTSNVQEVIKQAQAQMAVDDGDYPFNLNNIHPTDKNRIDQMVLFAAEKGAWEATCDRFCESYHGDTLNYALSELRDSQRNA